MATRRIHLQDGSVLDLRPIEGTDTARLDALHESLSDRTIYLRYFGAHPHLSDAELTRLTHVDHIKREAVVALSDDRIIAVGRYDDLDGVRAEIAFVVSDEWQGRGIGRILLEEIMASAQSVGLRELVAETLPNNPRMAAVFEHCGVPWERHIEDGVAHYTLRIATP